MASFFRGRDNVVFCAGVLLLAIILCLPDPSFTWSYLDKLKVPGAILTGRLGIADVSADFVGFRGLYYHTDPYPNLGEALKALGAPWDVNHANSHPPTAFLVVAPVALLPIKAAITAWAWFMLAAIVLGYVGFGFSVRMSIGLAAITLLWPPAALALGQHTPLSFLAIGWMFRNRQSAVSGVAIGIAALTKYVPGILIGPFIRTRNIPAVAAFASVCVISVIALALIDSSVFQRYLEVNRTLSVETVLRTDNASPLALSYRLLGKFGVVFMMGVFLYLWLSTLREQKDWEYSVILHSYLSVALLPIVWIYSTLPLLPVNIWLALKGDRPLVRLPALISLVTLLFCASWGRRSVPYISISVMLPCLCLLFYKRQQRLDIAQPNSTA